MAEGKHVDLDAEAKKPKNEDEFEVEVEFEDDVAPGNNNKYRFWGFQSFPEMFGDFMKNPQKTLNDFFGRSPANWETGGVKMRQRMDEMLPEESRQYFRESQKQWLLGWRDMIDKQLQRIEQEEELYRARQSGETPKKPGKSVQVEMVEDED
jgi:hypothetical protein